MNKEERFFGILMPIFSLPEKHGIGTLGEAAYKFVDFAKSCGAKVWQMLPLNVTSYGDSPYQSPSSTGLNYYFIDLETLVKEGLLKEDEIDDSLLKYDDNHVNYEKLFYNRIPLLKKAFSRFRREDKDFVEFVKEGEYNDFAFYMVLKEKNNYRPFYEWGESEKNYSPALEKKIKDEYKDLYEFYLWTQFEFLKQYKKLKEYANKNGISIMGDMPIYVAYDSVEAYKYPELFLFDAEHKPTDVAGVPPDAFSEDGQLWGNPLYDWEAQKATGYKWFNNRIAKNLELFDILRIDHFRGFSAYYAIPYGMSNAKIGKWVDGPKFDLFKDKTNLPIIAENLGVIDDGVINLLKETDYPGMEVVLFTINNDYEPDSNKPWNATKNTIAYVGTHDNETAMGTLKGISEEDLKLYKRVIEKCCDYLKISYKGDTLDDLVDTINRMALAYPSFGAIISMQDLLHLDNSARINFPSTLSTNNWSYRFSSTDFDDALANNVSELVEESKRK